MNNRRRGKDAEERVDEFLEANDHFIDRDEMQIWSCLTVVLFAYLVVGTMILRGFGMPTWVYTIGGIAIYFLPLAVILYKIYQRGHIRLPNGVSYEGQLLRHGVLLIGFLEFCAFIWWMFVR